MSVQIFHSNGPVCTEQIAAQLAASFVPGTLVAMRGGLGAGKTAFVRGACRVLAPGERVTSPSYAIINRYDGPVPVYHMDAYRIGSEDLIGIGWEDLLAENAIYFVEWSENLEGALPSHGLTVTFEVTGENDRRITVERREEGVC
ncbi:MAG: tRNA (adenosine(37)-N6)-threonylcarbamoyltransferase complex ATPase subunit type 1 TsaE [Clostridia bacterium]|nr:tRNA (adenosine(37)-N6)-threonylcarbamoyltransferase complex ATPase subunit type 1 TsaE [Clostridia bacterium]